MDFIPPRADDFENDLPKYIEVEVECSACCVTAGADAPQNFGVGGRTGTGGDGSSGRGVGCAADGEEVYQLRSYAIVGLARRH